MPELEKLTPFLMFQKGDAEAAMHFYLELFGDGEVVMLERFGPGEPGAEGSIKQCVIRIAGQQVRLFDSPSPHGFDFTPSTSLFGSVTRPTSSSDCGRRSATAAAS